jgi:phage terminase small subunit
MWAMTPLENAKHEIFARHIVEGMSGRDAYRAAGYSTASDESTDAAASRLLSDVKVAARVEELKAAAARASTVTAARVLNELAKLAFANMADYMRAGPDGDPYLDFSKLTRDQAAALVEVTVDDFRDGRGDDARTVRRVRFKLADKRAALVDIGKHLGMFKERVEHSGPEGGPIETRQFSDIEAVRFIGRLLTKTSAKAALATPAEPEET